MPYKIILPDGEQVFEEQKNAILAASELSQKINKILEVKKFENERWLPCATTYPSGEVRYPVDVGNLARNLKVRR